MWTMARMLPLIIGKYIPEEDDYWCHYLQLLDIMDYTMSPIVQRHTPAYLSLIIQENLEELYPDASFIPKMHYLVHVPQYLERLTII